MERVLSTRARMLLFVQLWFPMTLVSVSIAMLEILMVLQLAERGLDAAEIGLLSSLSILLVMITSIYAPVVARRIGIPNAHNASLVLLIACGLAYLVTDALPLWYVARVAIGVVWGFHWVVGQAWVITMSPRNRRGLVLSLDQMVGGLAYVVAPLVIAITHGNVSVALGMAVTMGIVALALLAPLGVPEESFLPGAKRRTILDMLISLLRFTPLLVVVAFVGGIAETSSAVVLPLYGLGIGLTEGDAALLVTVFSLGNILVQFPLGVVTDRLTLTQVRAVVIGALVMCAVALALLPLAGTSWLLVPLLVISGGAASSIATVNIIYTSRRLTGTQMMTAIGSMATAATAGGLVAPLLVGVALDYSPLLGMSVVLGGLMLVFAVIVAVFGRHTENKAETQTMQVVRRM